jgi:hypothetical protein
MRASSIANLFECGYRWEGQHILGMKRPASAAMHLGTSLHAGTAAFDSANIAGAPITTDAAVGVFVDTLSKPDEDVAEDEDDMPIKVQAAIGATLITQYVQQIVPTHTFVAVEQNVGKLTIATRYGDVQITGTLDRTRTRTNSDGKRGIADIKSGKTAVAANGVAATAGHHLQVGIYRLLEQVRSAEEMDDEDEVIGLHVAPKSARVGTGVIRNSTLSLLGTDEAPGLIELAARTLQSGIFLPNPKAKICGEKYCVRWNTCNYRQR